MAEPVSTWVQVMTRVLAPAIATLGDEIVDAAPALGVARIPVLHRGVLDLGIVEGDQLDDRGVELVLVALRRRAAFEIRDVGALVGDDQRALELAGVLLVDAEIGRQLHRAAHARRDVDERAVGEDRRVQRGEEVVRDRHDRAEILAHRSGYSRMASEIGMKITPAFSSSSLKVVATDTESNTASTATRCLAARRRPGSPARAAGCRASRRS